ncbi:MAG: peptidoglycan-associated lipoprotein Pal [Gammaproteobacteria bacterium]|nr:peptidoglycan-associated lipoprotein Pal [Gammaproteobacteria bacterium]MYD75316.1 peptidoglycan-associated lipoprotein Pal [Gammaproteobacteria bacterium]MYJ51987.1 peptidoglycan-associated lipoprotein Pal [Gammaproteobacteria bacterium]
MRQNTTLVSLLATAFLVTACSTPQKSAEESEPAPEEEVVVVDHTQSASATGLASEEIDGGALDSGSGQSAQDAVTAPKTVYFDYDSSVLTQESQSVVQVHAINLTTHPNLNIVLEGHADERGTREYNLALGEERARAVADVMQAFGITSDRIQIISYGEEQPAVLESNEDAWALNRRVEILY